MEPPAMSTAAATSNTIPTYFVVMIDHGRRGREAVVDPEITRNEVIARLQSGEYTDVLFIQLVAPGEVPRDVTDEIVMEADVMIEQRRAA
jgi:hypothetical protein